MFKKCIIYVFITVDIIAYRIFLYLKRAIMDTLQVKNDFSLREDLIILSFVVCKTVSFLKHLNFL